MNSVFHSDVRSISFESVEGFYRMKWFVHSNVFYAFCKCFFKNKNINF